MRKFNFILLLLVSFSGVAQKFADKEYYLVDSLAMEELSEEDNELVENALEAYHSSKTDTGRIDAINTIIEESWNNKLWPKYNVWVYEFVQEKLKTKVSPRLTKKFKIYLTDAINNIGYLYDVQGNNNKALEYYQKGLEIDIELDNKKGMAVSYNNIGLLYKKQGKIMLCLDYYDKSLDLYMAVNDRTGVAVALNNLASIYDDQGEVIKALEYFHRSLKMRDKNDKMGIAVSLGNLGSMYRSQGDTILALEYFLKALEIGKEIAEERVTASALRNISALYENKGNIVKAIEYLNMSLELYKKAGYKQGVADALNQIGHVYQNDNNNELAKEYFTKSFKLHSELKNQRGMAVCLNNMASLAFSKNEIKGKKGAEILAKMSLEISKSIGYPIYIKNSANLLSKIYVKQNRGMEALDMYQLFIFMRDSINNESTQKASAKQQAKYEYEKQKSLDDAEHDKLLAIEQEEKDKQQILTGATAGGLGLVVVFLIFVFNRLRVTKKQKLVIEEQKVEVEQQKEVLELAHSELEEKNQEIMDSIVYAKRIQSAILPANKVVKEYLKESFILYKPKDIVAGDFYWMEHKDNKVLFAAADCTGHGVPGAMVSVICNNGLNRAVREHGLSEPGKILDKTREIVIQEFEKSEEEVKDGMDIALCSLEGNKLKYAGAHNPLWIIRNSEIIETKANKQPIGQFDNPEAFTTHSFDLEKGDSIYIFSDGYVDQFGGEKGKKFKARAFRELLLSIQDKSMEEQKTMIDDAFETWKGSLEQIDDVCIIGVKI